MQNKLRIAAVFVAALVLAVGSYLAYEKYSRRTHVITMVEDAAVRVRAVVEAQPGTPTQIDFEAHATALEGYAATLRRMNTASFTPLADAADDYLVTAREIGRRAVEIQKSSAALDASYRALAAHMKADRGAAGWPAEAVRLKQAADKDLRDYRLAVDAYRMLLESFPASQWKVVPLVDKLPLIEDSLVKGAAAKALDAYRAAEQTVKQVADLNAYAGRR
ncbi:MAG TPA: hypothetical protein VHP37_10055 [Burkholderiales bacterium]|nr:hypothetical protein [Burkholderiales bacterium]